MIRTHDSHPGEAPIRREPGSITRNAEGDHPLARLFRDFVAEVDFPCLGAKASLNASSLDIRVARDITDGADDRAIHRALVDLADLHGRAPMVFRSLAVIFAGPLVLDEAGFEGALWRRVQSLTELDVQDRQPADIRTSSNPADPRFSLSFGGQGFFVVGLHPAASRHARRFGHPVMVFNLHDQFERLRADGRYDRLRDRILQRDAAYSGCQNPMLARHGEVSEARQYSGRAVRDDWHAPFRRPAAALPNRTPRS